MDLECAHLVINASDVVRSKNFYIERLGFQLIEEHPQSFAFRAGSIRVSVSPNGTTLKDEDPCNTSILFKTPHLQKTISKNLRNLFTEKDRPSEAGVLS